MDELECVRLLLMVGRSPDEQHMLLNRLGCLSERGKVGRMGVIRLLDRVYEGQVRDGLAPIVPSPTVETALVEASDLLGTAGARADSPIQRLARIQASALAEAGYLDREACRGSSIDAWWENARPQVCVVHEEMNPLFAAVVTEKPGTGKKSDGGGKGAKSEAAEETEILDPVAAFRAVLTPLPQTDPPAKPQTRPINRIDPITCPTCGRPAPRRATYCVWCGLWLAARPR